MSALCCFSTAWWLSSGLMTLGIQWITDGLSYLSHTWYHRCHDGFLKNNVILFLQKENIFLSAFFWPSSCSKQSWMISIRCSFALLPSIPSYLWSWSNAILVSALQPVQCNTCTASKYTAGVGGKRRESGEEGLPQSISIDLVCMCLNPT